MSGNPYWNVGPTASGHTISFDDSGSLSIDGEPIGTSVPTPVMLGIGNQNPGAAQASFVNEGLGSMTPLVSLFDGAGVGPFALAKQGDVILAGISLEDEGTASFIGHDLSLINRSTDGGQTWTGVATPWDAQSPQVMAIAFGTDSEVVVVGIANGICFAGHSIDGGLTWTDITAGFPADVFVGASVASVIAYDGTNWFLALSPGGMWVATDATETWANVTTGLTDENLALVIATSTTVIAASATEATPLLAVSHDHGTTWTPVSSDMDGGQVYGITPDGDGHWLLWGENGSTATIEQSLDDGDTWESLAVPISSANVAIGFLPGTGWVTMWSGASAEGGVLYSAPVATPLVFTPTAYIDSTIYVPEPCFVSI